MRAQRAPAKMEIADLDARAGGPFKLLDNRAARPVIRDPADDDIAKSQRNDQRQRGDKSHTECQSKFSFRAAHAPGLTAVFGAGLTLVFESGGVGSIFKRALVSSTHFAVRSPMPR